MSSEDSNRYSRQTVLKEIGTDGQKILNQSKVIVIGCGALGTNSANLLCRAGIGEVCIVDRDIIELNNLQRQTLFSEEDVGSSKAQIAHQKLTAINSKIKISYLVKDVNSNNIENLILGYQLVVDATDNFQTRMLINDAAVKNKIPWIYGGVIGTKGMVLPILPNGPCFRCLNDDLPEPGTTPTCETTGILNTIPAIIASIQCTQAIKLLLKDEVRTNLLVFDVWNQELDKIKVNKDENCSCCSQKKFTFLEQGKKEIIVPLCQQGYRIHPATEQNINLKEFMEKIQKQPSVSIKIIDDQFAVFTMEGKKVTLFNSGGVIIKGISDKGALKSFYSRLLGV